MNRDKSINCNNYDASNNMAKDYTIVNRLIAILFIHEFQNVTCSLTDCFLLIL